jgi:hypothetical protein
MIYTIIVISMCYFFMLDLGIFVKKKTVTTARGETEADNNLLSASVSNNNLVE